MKCVLDGQIMSTYWETIGELVSAMMHGGETGVHRGTVLPLEREILQ